MEALQAGRPACSALIEYSDPFIPGMKFQLPAANRLQQLLRSSHLLYVVGKEWTKTEFISADQIMRKEGYVIGTKNAWKIIQIYVEIYCEKKLSPIWL